MSTSPLKTDAVPDSHRCFAGAAMNSEPRRVPEYWHRRDRRYVEGTQIINGKAYHKWIRDPSLEIDIQPEWVRVGNEPCQNSQPPKGQLRPAKPMHEPSRTPGFFFATTRI